MSIEIRYLDTNFPFFNNFPRLPNLSHKDGKKIDISFIYQTSDKEMTSQKKSRSGYGIFEKPKLKNAKKVVLPNIVIQNILPREQ